MSPKRCCSLKDWVAKIVAVRVEQPRGSACARSVSNETKLVDTKLEMVRPAGLFHCGADVLRIRWINSGDRLQRDEIH